MFQKCYSQLKISILKTYKTSNGIYFQLLLTTNVMCLQHYSGNQEQVYHMALQTSIVYQPICSGIWFLTYIFFKHVKKLNLFY